MTTARDVIATALWQTGGITPQSAHDRAGLLLDALLSADESVRLELAGSPPKCPRCGWRASVYETLPAPPSEDKAP